ncbi:MAG: type II secretion system F family protein [Planctomycetes bacterium]|nr:type II secretion system F family protein [Planctomycetota bacterium]
MIFSEVLSCAQIFTPVIPAIVIFLAVIVGVLTFYKPITNFILRRETYYDHVLRGSLLIDINPRTVTLMSLGVMFLLAGIGYLIIHSILMVILGIILGAFLPSVVLKLLRRYRLRRLDDQIVDGIQTLISAVRAGLNLVQAMELLAKNGPRPISQEFAHLVREYEHGVSLEKAMQNAAARIGSANYRLLFAALLTHRERGGDLADTLERIADSIREIYRLEKRVETLTAPNRTAARWMGAMPAVVLGVLYLIDPYGVRMLFTTPAGRVILLIIVVLNVIGFLWIRKIVSIDI